VGPERVPRVQNRRLSQPANTREPNEVGVNSACFAKGGISTAACGLGLFSPTLGKSKIIPDEAHWASVELTSSEQLTLNRVQHQHAVYFSISYVVFGCPKLLRVGSGKCTKLVYSLHCTSTRGARLSLHFAKPIQDQFHCRGQGHFFCRSAACCRSWRRWPRCRWDGRLSYAPWPPAEWGQTLIIPLGLRTLCS